jgi:hypothetical protein
MRKSIAVCLFAAIAAIPGLSAWADPITVPAGLNPGDQYRLAFVTSTSKIGGFSDIAVYNAFVTTVANSVPQLAALGTTWSAIGSTGTVNAYDNTDTNPNTAIGDPIYNLGGNLVASSNAVLWSNNPRVRLTSPIDINESGTVFTTEVFTGTKLTGVADTNALHPRTGLPLAFAIAGNDIATSSSWVFFNPENVEVPLPFYALSGVLTVVPEPGTMVLACLAAAGLAAASLGRRLCRKR